MNTKNKCDAELIGKRIANSRKISGLTQEQLAQKVGIVGKHLSEIERGLSGVAVGTLIEIAKVLNVSTDYLLLGKEPQSTPIYSLFSQLSPKQKQYAEEIISLFVNCINENNE